MKKVLLCTFTSVLSAAWVAHCLMLTLFCPLLFKSISLTSHLDCTFCGGGSMFHACIYIVYCDTFPYDPLMDFRNPPSQCCQGKGLVTWPVHQSTRLKALISYLCEPQNLFLRQILNFKRMGQVIIANFLFSWLRKL